MRFHHNLGAFGHRGFGANVCDRSEGFALNCGARQVDAIRESISRGDAKTLEVNAHTLKSSAANLGAASVAEHASRLERMGKTTELEGASALFSRLEAELQTARMELEKIRDEKKS